MADGALVPMADDDVIADGDGDDTIIIMAGAEVTEDDDMVAAMADSDVTPVDEVKADAAKVTINIDDPEVRARARSILTERSPSDYVREHVDELRANSTFCAPYARACSCSLGLSGIALLVPDGPGELSLTDILADFINLFVSGVCSHPHHDSAWEEDGKRTQTYPLSVLAGLTLDTDLLDALVTAGLCDVTARAEPEGHTLLHMALLAAVESTEEKSVSFIRRAIELGADVNAEDKSSMTPFYVAYMICENLTLCGLLVKAGAKVDHTPQGCLNPLGKALRAADSRKLKELLDLGANVNAPCVSDVLPVTWIMATMPSHQMVGLLETLLQQPGADPEGRGHQKRHEQSVTFLHDAVLFSMYGAAECLLRHGADPNTRLHSGDTCLTLLASSTLGNNKMFKLLVENKADANATDSTNYSPLHFASWFGNGELVTYLLAQEGIKVDEQTNDKNTPFSLACHRGEVGNAKLLLPRGPNVNNADKDNDTPLIYATFNGEAELVDLLLQAGASPHDVTKQDVTPVWNCATAGDQRCMRALLRCNVDCSVTSRGVDQQEGNSHTLFDTPVTPLQAAWSYGQWDAVKLLLGNGVEPAREGWVLTEEVSPEEEEQWGGRMRALRADVCSPPRLLSLVRLFIRLRMRGRPVEQVRAQFSTAELPRSLCVYLWEVQEHDELDAAE